MAAAIRFRLAPIWRKRAADYQCAAGRSPRSALTAPARRRRRYAQTSPGVSARNRSSGIPSRRKSRREPLPRFLDRLVGQVKRPPVAAGSIRGAGQHHAVRRLFRVLVLRLHEPARLVGADRQDRQAQAAMLCMPAAGSCAFRESRCRRRNRPCRSRPRRRSPPTAPCAGRACRAPTSDGPVRRGQHCVRLPGAATAASQSCAATRMPGTARRSSRRCRAASAPAGRSARCNAASVGEVEMVVMVVADQHHVDRRQGRPRDAGRR